MVIVVAVNRKRNRKNISSVVSVKTVLFLPLRRFDVVIVIIVAILDIPIDRLAVNYVVVIIVEVVVRKNNKWLDIVLILLL